MTGSATHDDRGREDRSTTKAAPNLSVVFLQSTTISSKESVTYNKETQTVGVAPTETREGKMGLECFNNN